MSMDLFKPEDFMYGRTDFKQAQIEIEWALHAVDVANRKLNAYIQCLEKVYGDITLGSYHGMPLLWSVDEKPESTHSVRLIGLEKIQRDPT